MNRIEETLKALRCEEPMNDTGACSNGNCPYSIDGDCNFKQIDTDAANEIDRLTAENEALKAKMRWIPVGERPPEKEDEYLVYTEENDIFKAKFSEGEFGTYTDVYDPHTLGFLDSEWNKYDGITHWMESPRPPKEEIYRIIDGKSTKLTGEMADLAKRMFDDCFGDDFEDDDTNE